MSPLGTPRRLANPPRVNVVDDWGVTGSDGWTPEEAWSDLVDSARPPHRDNDWFAPCFWPLIQAAHAEPALRALYPGQSMMFLGFFEDNHWWQQHPDTLASRPRIATTADGRYHVIVGMLTSTQTELLSTSDPAEAVRFVVNMLAEQA